jgi:hypothetical protein
MICRYGLPANALILQQPQSSSSHHLLSQSLQAHNDFAQVNKSFSPLPVASVNITGMVGKAIQRLPSLTQDGIA